MIEIQPTLLHLYTTLCNPASKGPFSFSRVLPSAVALQVTHCLAALAPVGPVCHLSQLPPSLSLALAYLALAPARARVEL